MELTLGSIGNESNVETCQLLQLTFARCWRGFYCLDVIPQLGSAVAQSLHPLCQHPFLVANANENGYH